MATNNEAMLSAVIVAHNQAEALEQNLPLFLTCAKEAGCRVIVVDNESSDETPDVLKRMCAEHDNLYTTFLPASVVNNSRLQLALSVGVKAARSQYVMLADINRPPRAASWLTPPADGEVTLVYSGRKADDTRVWFQPFDTLDDARPLLLKGERKSGRGRKGHWCKLAFGHYDAVVVSQERQFDAIRCFDRPVSGFRLAGIALRVCWKNMFHRPKM